MQNERPGNQSKMIESKRIKYLFFGGGRLNESGAPELN